MAFDLTSTDVDISAGEKILALDPGLNELGERVALLYFPSAEVTALGLT